VCDVDVKDYFAEKDGWDEVIDKLKADSDPHLRWLINSRDVCLQKSHDKVPYRPRLLHLGVALRQIDLLD
jgi:hypothetical protein